MRVVFDTNIFVSAFAIPGGRADAALRRILECALAGRAEAIVTGDRALLELGQHEGVRIVTLRGYIESSAAL